MSFRQILANLDVSRIALDSGSSRYVDSAICKGLRAHRSCPVSLAVRPKLKSNAG